MNSEEYKNAISSNNVLDYSTLNITLKEVFASKDIGLTYKLERILRDNKIQKPETHSKKTERTTDYFKVDLLPEEINKIIDLFLNLEAMYVDENGNTTSTASFYATLVDKWNGLI